MCKNAIDEGVGINKLLDDLLIHLKQRGYAQSSLRTYGGIYERLRAYCAELRFLLKTWVGNSRPIVMALFLAKRTDEKTFHALSPCFPISSGLG